MAKRVTAPASPADAAIGALDAATTVAALRTATKEALRKILEEQRRSKNP